MGDIDENIVSNGNRSQAPSAYSNASQQQKNGTNRGNTMSPVKHKSVPGFSLNNVSSNAGGA